MPEYDDIEDDTTEDSPSDEGMRGLRQAKKAAEQRAKEAETALAAANAERREDAAVRAGLDLGDKTTQKFLEHYDGDPSQEAMKVAAIEWGLISDGSSEAQEAAAAQQQMARTFGGGETVPLGTQPIGPTGMQVPATEVPMWKEFEEQLKAGNFTGGAEVLRRHGHGVADVAGHEMLPGGNTPQTSPLQ